jgi:hypothetical protein
MVLPVVLVEEAPVFQDLEVAVVSVEVVEVVPSKSPISYYLLQNTLFERTSMPIRMLGLVNLKPINGNPSAFQEMVEDTARALGLNAESLDAVGHEDDDVDNDGDSDSSDAYLKNRRKTVTKAVKSESIGRNALKRIIKEEYEKLQEEIEKTNKKIETGLDEIRKECFTEMLKRTREMGNNFGPALEKRMHINTVAEMLEVQVNELMLYFLNNVKHTNERHLVEYRQGHVTFYAN